ncbi:hypothetical protein GCM10009677_51340 [Sphaerisporangium rubeum]
MPFGQRLGPDGFVGGHVVLDDGAQYGQLAIIEQRAHLLPALRACVNAVLALSVPECQVYGSRRHGAITRGAQHGCGRYKRVAIDRQVTWSTLLA